MGKDGIKNEKTNLHNSSNYDGNVSKYFVIC